jgi:hypothetical protein
LTVASGGTGTVSATASNAGNFVIVPNGVTGFVESISNLSSVTNLSSSVAGSDAETVAHARQRLETGDTLTLSINGVQRAIESIDGISNARVFYNYYNDALLTLQGGTVLNPRTAYISILGNDDTNTAIAEAYLKRMLAPTQGSLSQQYTTLANQNISVYYNVASYQAVYVKVYYDSNITPSTNFEALAESVILAISLDIGMTLSTETILSVLSDFSYASIVDAELSLDGTTYSGKIIADANKMPQFSAANIIMVAL